jgi:hypothetical protein
MIEVLLEQAAIFVAAGVALAQQLLAAELVPLLLGTIGADLNCERIARLSAARRARSTSSSAVKRKAGSETSSR